MKKIFFGLLACLILAGMLSSAASAADSPKVVYEKYFKACKAGDMSFVNYVSEPKKAEFKAMKKEQQVQLAAMLKAMMPESYKMEKEEIKGKKATLTVSAKQAGAVSRGIVLLTLEKGLWKIEKENWTTKN